MRDQVSRKLPSRISTVGMVLSRPRYVFIAILVALMTMSVSLLLFKMAIIKFVFAFPGYSLGDRLNFLVSTFFALGFFPSILSKITVIVLSLLTGIYGALTVYYFTNRTVSYRAGGLGFPGIFLGIVGVGCTVCGSVVLVSLLGFSAAYSILALLPWRGAEISVMGVLVLGFSLYFISGKIRDPLICKMNHLKN